MKQPVHITLELLRTKLYNPVYTVEEVAKFLRLSDTTVRKLVQSGDLKAFRIGSTYRFFNNDLRIVSSIYRRHRLNWTTTF